MRRGHLRLTFDDGPCPDWTPRVLDALDRSAALATFFVLGSAAARHPELVQRTVDAGHRVELHGHEHLRHDRLTRAALGSDTAIGLEAVRRAGGDPRWWRAPWGVETDETQLFARVHGLRLIRWDVDTHDWRGDRPDAMLAAVARDAPEGGVVLAHDALGPGATRAGCGNTVAFVERVVRWARGRDLVVDALPALDAPSTATNTTATRPLVANG